MQEHVKIHMFPNLWKSQVEIKEEGQERNRRQVMHINIKGEHLQIYQTRQANIFDEQLIQVLEEAEAGEIQEGKEVLMGEVKVVQKREEAQ